MRYSGIPLILLLSMTACDQQPAAPSNEAVPAFAKSSLDKNSVLRFQDHFATSWTGENSTLRATHTTFPIPDFEG